MTRPVVRLSPWLLAVAAFAVFLVIPGVNGPVLALAWGGVIALFRVAVAVAPYRPTRQAIDGTLIVACALAAFEGGWYLLPAAVAFLVVDMTAPKATVPIGE